MRVAVARIGRALGIKGELLIDVLTDEPERRLAPGCEVLLGDRVLVIATERDHGKRIALRFVGVDDRTAAEALTGGLLEIERDPDERPEDPEEFYDDQIIGLRACHVDGVEIGLVTEVIHLPSQDLLAVKGVDATELLIPFVVEIVPTVDLEGGRVLSDPPPGLLDPDSE